MRKKKVGEEKVFSPSRSLEYFANNAFVGFGRAWEGGGGGGGGESSALQRKGKERNVFAKAPLPPLSSFLHRLHNGQGAKRKGSGFSKKGYKLLMKNNFTEFDFALAFTKF